MIAPPRSGRAASSLLIALALAMPVAIGACGSPGDTPEGTVQALFESVKRDDVEGVGRATSAGQVDLFDMKHLRELFGPEEVLAVEAKVVRQDSEEATIALSLVTDSGQLPGRVPLELVHDRDGWKIDYSGWSWPTALKSANFR